jgi:hypothetical protein
MSPSSVTPSDKASQNETNEPGVTKITPDPVRLQRLYTRQASESGGHSTPAQLQAVGMNEATDEDRKLVNDHIRTGCERCRKALELFREHAEYVRGLPAIDSP